MLVPAEKWRSKPDFLDFILLLSSFLASMFVLILAFSVLWAFCMRLIYGSDSVREWLSADLAGRPAVGIEKLFRKACFLVL